jgi:CO/xanthine dehydrogenase FAD-binding subunit
MDHNPGLVDAAALIGGIQIQNRASLGGNLCNASPAADGIPALIVNAVVGIIVRMHGHREVAVESAVPPRARRSFKPVNSWWRFACRHRKFILGLATCVSRHEARWTSPW